MLSVPIFTFPTTIVCVDDDKNFLDYLSAGINALNNHNIKCFTHPEEAVEFFKNYKSPLSQTSFLRGFTEHEYYYMSNHAPVDFDVNNVINLSNQQDRYQEVSILIADYDMPQMDGIELCELMKNHPFKKILLTGEVDYKRATNALNDEVIDCFIPKLDVSNFLSGVRSHVATLEKRYFIDLTEPLRSHLETNHPLPISDPAFAKFFDQWLKQHEIKEYYLSDKNGGFLTVDAKGNRSCLIVQTDRSLDALVDLYDDDNELYPFINTIKERKQIPFFGLGKRLEQLEPKDLSSHLYTPEVIQGRERYYCYSVKL